MSKSLPTIDEIINTLKRSSMPTILIEGSDDVYIYRYLKQKFVNRLVNLQPCGGRINLFTIYDRREEFTGKKVLFIADKDSYRFSGVPEDKCDVIFTEGYCIENDIYDGSDIEDILDAESLPSFNITKDCLIRWFTFELQKYIDSNHQQTMAVGHHINYIIPDGTSKICSNFIAQIGYQEPRADVLDLIISNVNLNIRGKQLFQTISRYMTGKGRFSSFSDKNLVEVALKMKQTEHTINLITKVNEKLVA
ncbi:DUF4435 domain-containing protein [Photobacterium phosphoreum]|uniref:DUF4435 domain-containing protein n=1 Tax=Photobacterium phosphoreum TaxID=659 RepID=UPI0015E75B9D|nr:DUF4435 domain-containing protein [Photobacterium phosphoreum]